MQGEIGLYLPVVLHKCAEQFFAVVRTGRARQSGHAVETTVLYAGSIVQEIEDVVEVVAGTADGRADVVKDGEICPELDSVRAQNLGRHILIAIGPLVDDAP